MFSARNTDSPNPFRPALQYLLSSGKKSRAHHRHTTSSGSIDTEDSESRSMASSLHPKNSSEFRSNSIPLISISRSPSPFQRRRSDSNPASEATDEDDWGDYPSSSRRSLLPADGYRLTGWKYYVYGGGFGQWLFTTPLGWTFYIGVLVIWLGGCQIGLTVMNRIIMWTGVYKFNWPLTTALIEMLMTHCWILLSAYITRWTSPWLVTAGVSSMVAPSKPLPKATQGGFRGMQKNGGGGFLDAIFRWTSNFSGGIAGGGLFEMEWAVAKQVLPLAIIFIAKISLSNLSFAYAELQIYTLARIAIVPFSLIFTSTLNGTSHSVTTLSSTLTATLTLLIALSRTSMRAAWEAIVAGVFSSIFVALYPVQIQRTYKSLVASLIPQGELIGTFPSTNTPTDYSGSREETRAYWRLLHYTSTLSILIFIPIVILSGELTDISRNCYFLDLFWPWLMIVCGGLGSWATFWSTIALTRATSPLSTTFLFVPRAAFLSPIMAGFKLPAFAWIGIGMCWSCCGWFLTGRRREGRPVERMR